MHQRETLLNKSKYAKSTLYVKSLAQLLEVYMMITIIISFRIAPTHFNNLIGKQFQRTYPIIMVINMKNSGVML